MKPLSTILLVLATIFSSFSQTVCKRTVADFGPSSTNYTIEGSATLTDSAGILTLSLSDDFSTNNGPDLFLYLSKNNEAPTVPGNTNVEVAQLISNKGAQSYTVPGNTKIDDFDYVSIHCKAFNSFWDGGPLGAKTCQISPTYANIDLTACDSMVSPSKKYTWDTSGIYIDTLISGNTAGGDSIITIDLTIHRVDTSLTITDTTLLSNAVNASYQWLDCNDNDSIILGDTSKVFTFIKNGSYAVEVTQNGCVDTSVCIDIQTVGIQEITLFKDVKIYPNPNMGRVHIDAGQLQIFSIKVFNENGQLVYQKEQITGPVFQFDLQAAAGIYNLELKAKNARQNYKLIIQSFN